MGISIDKKGGKQIKREEFEKKVKGRKKDERR